MTDERYVITGVNVLTGDREEISRAMSKEECEARLERERESRKRIKYQAHVRLRVERRLPIQLTLNFNSYDD